MKEAKGIIEYLDKADRQESAQAADVAKLESTWSVWVEKLDEDPGLARQVPRKVLAAPIAVRPTGKGEWRFAGFSRFDAVLAGGVARGSGFAEIRDLTAPLVYPASPILAAWAPKPPQLLGSALGKPRRFSIS